MSDLLGEIAVQVPADPDAQATVTDFLDYTEYLPADLIRSLTLIRKLDESYLVSSSKVHELAKLYGVLPLLPPHERRDPQLLRAEISQYLSRAISTRSSTYAEASRLYDVVDHHYNRLTSIIAKLETLPQPPSRDPSPAPQAAASQQGQRSRRGRNTDEENPPAPRITLRLDAAKSAAAASSGTAGSQRRNRSRKITVPGEVLPPPNPDSPPPSSESDWESPPPSPVPMPTSRVGAPPRRARSTSTSIKLPKPTKPNKLKPPKPPRVPAPNPAPAPVGTNAHSVVAGISTSNALALLKPPPEDAVPGSEHAPWLRLTQWEMAKLRKRMKKNAVWCPSETMIRRELADLGRGPENYHAAKARAETTGEPFVDASNIAGRLSQPGKRVLAEGEISADSLGMEEIQLSNRGMKLNEAKKLKKENLQREAAAQAAAQAAADAQLTGHAPGEMAGDRDIVTTDPGDDIGQSVALAPRDKDAHKSSRKRRRETSSEDDGDEITMGASNPASKRRKHEGAILVPTTLTTTSTTTTVPLAGPGPSGLGTSVDQSTSEGEAPSTGNRRRHASAVPKVASSPEHSFPRPRSRGTTAPTEAATTAGRDRPRRASTISTAAVEPAPAARVVTRRGKRPVPGRLTADGGEGGPAVTVGKRTAAPRPKPGAKRPKGDAPEAEAEADEEGLPVDPNEPRYCVCGDVSFGTMIQCENGDCEREWFHLDCVGLNEPPGRTTKWYCPDCRKRLGIGEKGQVGARSKKK